MNRYEFIGELRGRLKRLPPDELQDAVNYYEEYFDEAGIGYNPVDLSAVGTPASVASEILAQTAVRQVENNPKSPRSGILAVVFMVLAILGAPIALPLAIALAAVVCSLAVAMGAVILALFIAAGAVAFAGVVALVAAVVQLIVDPVTGIVFLGIALLLLGIGIMFITLIYFLTSRGIPAVIKISKKLLNKSERGEAV